MKKLLSLFLTVAMACSLAVTASAAEEPAAAASDPDLTGSIVILHTNDVHGGIAGYAQVAAQKQYYQKCGAYVLLFDAGDFIQGDPTRQRLAGGNRCRTDESGRLRRGRSGQP